MAGVLNRRGPIMPGPTKGDKVFDTVRKSTVELLVHDEVYLGKRLRLWVVTGFSEDEDCAETHFRGQYGEEVLENMYGPWLVDRLTERHFEMWFLDSRDTLEHAEVFTEYTAPDWLTSVGQVKGSTMDDSWFFEKHVLTLEVGQSVDTDFRRITRTK